MKLPDNGELIFLRDVLLAHALGTGAKRQRDALAYIFQEQIDKRESCPKIDAATLYNVAAPSDANSAKNAAYGLVRDIKKQLDSFYEKNPSRLDLRYRAQFVGGGDYRLKFPSYDPTPQQPVHAPEFWRPHLPPIGNAEILYPEPVFFMDQNETYFRNSAMGTEANRAAIRYLKIPGKLETGYSYVPAGIVQGMLHLIRALRIAAKHAPADFPKCGHVRSSLAIPSQEGDLIVLATPTSTKLVNTLQAGMKMKVLADGIHVAGHTSPKNDSDETKWGVLTRTTLRERVVTMLAAKHGRSVEAMVVFLTIPSNLARLAKHLSVTDDFPETFQVLFRIPTANTTDGPSFQKAVIEPLNVVSRE